MRLEDQAALAILAGLREARRAAATM